MPPTTKPPGGPARGVFSAFSSLHRSRAGGGALSILWLEKCRAGRLCGALESSALFLRGDGEARLYDLSAAITGSFSLEDVTRGVGVGVHGNLGLHAFLGERFYARGQIGYLGAAVGGVKGELGIGYRFE